MTEGCRFTAYRPVKGDTGFEQGDTLYMDKISPCGAAEWRDGLCREHSLVMMRTEEAKSVAVITDSPGGMSFGSLDQKSRGGKRGGGRHGNRGRALPADMVGRRSA